MKKIFPILLMLLFIPISFVFSACSNLEEVAGTYKLAEMYTEDHNIIKLGEKYKDLELEKNSAVLVLNLDEGKTATYKDANFEQEIHGTWDKRENFVLFAASELQTIELEFEIKDGKDLLLIVDGEAVILLKKEQS